MRETVIDKWKNFLNRETLLEVTIDVKDLPADDDWIMDDEWDEIYKESVGEIK